MGVHGLWRLIEPSGKPVPLETLENKVLAVDVSIWLHQLVKGFQDSKGAPLPNAHLLGIYHRICKLLYFRIKPVFVFDGGVPVLKKQTMAKRNQQKAKNLSEADRIHRNLLSTLLQHSAISKVLSEKAKAAISATLPAKSPPKKSKKQEDDLYMLPAPSQSLDSTLSSSEDESSAEDSNSAKQYDLHSIDTNSKQFKSLPVDVRHEILTDLKETRKQSSWGRIHEMPTESDDFATYQMRRLLKRQSVQTALEEVEKEMGGHTLSLGELEKILKDQGVISTTTGNMKGSRIASDENTRFLLIKDIKQAIENAKKQSELPAIEESTEEEEGEQKVEKCEEEVGSNTKNKGDVEYEEDLKRAIALSLEDEPSTSKEIVENKTPEKVKVIGGNKGKNRMPLSFLENFNDADFFDSESSEDELTPTRLTPAQRYMMEYSGLTAHEIARIIASKRGPSKKQNTEQEKKVTGESVPAKEIHPNLNKDERIEKLVNITDKNTTSFDQGHDQGNEVDKESILNAEGNEHDKVKQSIERESLVNDQAKDVPVKEKIIILQNIKIPQVSEDSNNDKHEVKTENKETTEQIKEKEVELMSDSESSNCDDFLEVEESNKEKGNSGISIMEVVINLDDKIEDDDLFKDIFTNQESNKETSAKNVSQHAEIVETKLNEYSTESVTVQSPVKSVDQVMNFTENETESAVKSTDKVVDLTEKEIPAERPPEKEHIPSLKDKITRMIKTYSTSKDDVEKLSEDQMKEIKENLSIEQEELVAQRSTKERLAGNITEQMYQEAQELLELFGVPYLIAPMEAEAQCAFLDLINLTDGTITDDSDIWLFGGRTVYKNFFNQSKTVLEFKSENIHQHFKLTREQMILLAMLVGSDYTIGLTGVGPVTALEILAAFPPKNQLLSGLADFKVWFNRGKLPGPGRTSLRSKLKNVTFTENFPNPQVAQAYLEPQVETSKENFSWAKPDVVGLVDFAKQKFGWTKYKTEEILHPILKRLEDRNKQKTITDYFKMEYKIDSGDTETKMSKRVKTAITKIGKQGNESEEEEPKVKRKKVVKKNEGDKSQTKQETKRASNKKYKQKVDEEIEILKQTEVSSEKRLEEIHKDIQKKIEQTEKKRVNLLNLHKREVIPQKQKDKTDILKNKLKAIETFRKSKQGPGYVKKKAKTVRATKEDASYLSESSDSN